GFDRALLCLGDAEAPRVGPVRRARRNPLRMLGMNVQPFAQLAPLHRLMHGGRVTDDVEVALSEVDDATARGVRDPRIRDVPFAWDGPVEDLRAARHLGDLEWQHLTPEPEAFAAPLSPQSL